MEIYNTLFVPITLHTAETWNNTAEIWKEGKLVNKQGEHKVDISLI